MGYPLNMSIEIAGVTINTAIVAPLRITNGRTNLLEPLGQFSCTFTVFKERLEYFFGLQSKDVRQAGLGALVEISSEISNPPSGRVWFNGIVTDVSSDAYTITFTAIDLNAWKLSKAPPLSPTTGVRTADLVIQELCDAVGADYVISAGINADTYIESQTVTNYLELIRTVIGGNATAFGYFAPPGDQPSVGLKIVDRETDVIYPAATVSLATTDVKKDYSITRSIGDILNEIEITYSDGLGGTLTSTSINQTSIDAIGTRSYSRSVFTASAAEVDRIEKGLLAAGAPYGFPLVNFRIHSSFVTGSGINTKNAFDYFQPNNRLDTAGLISQHGFDSIMFIEQVTWSISEKDIVIDLLCSSDQYSTMPQEWQNVTGSTTWASISSLGYTWDDLLYTRL